MSYSLGSVLDWNWLALSACSVPVAQFAVLAASEASPRWLVSKGQLGDAKKALAYFRGCSEYNLVKHVECELKDMEHQLKNAGQVRRLDFEVKFATFSHAKIWCTVFR